MGQLCDGSHVSWVTKDDPFPSLDQMHRLRAFKLHYDLETEVRGHSKSSKVALIDRAHRTLYSSSIVTMPLSNTLSEIYPHIGRKLLVFATPLYLAPPLGVKPSDLRNDLWCRKTRMLDLSDSERISMIRSTVFD